MTQETIFKSEIANSINYNKIAEEITKKTKIHYDKTKNWYIWNDKEKKYEIIDETDILINVEQEMNIANISHPSIKAQIINSLEMEARKNKPKDLTYTQIQFKDKIIDITTNKELTASSEYFTFNPIPWNIGLSEETPKIDELIKSWVKTEDKTKIYEWIAYHLINDYPIHRVAVLNGSGSNGKSTLLELMRRFLGEQNITAGDFTSVFIQRFGTSILYKKIGIFIPEANFETIEKTGTFKSATGGDQILIEFKNKNPTQYKNTAKVTISTNSLPITLDKTDGFYRRFLIIDFPNKFKEKYDLLKNIPKEEYENLAKKSIRILKEILEKGSFTNEGTTDEKRERYEKISNPISTFLEEEIIDDGELYISKKDYHNKLNQWLKSKGLRLLTNREINKIMKESYEEGWRKKQDTDGNSQTERAWLGIYWKKEYKQLRQPIIVTEENIK